MSKQSNQRYRKEKEKEHLKKAGLDGNSSDHARNQDRDKLNIEYDTPHNKTGR